MDDLELGPSGSSASLIAATLDFLARRRLPLIASLAGGVALGAWSYATSPDVYMASTKLFVDEPAVAASAADANAARKVELRRRIDVLRSIPVADAAQRLLDAGSRPRKKSDEETPEADEGAELEMRLKEPGRLGRLLALRSSIQVNADYDNCILVISCSGGNPEDLAKRVHAFAQAYQRISLARKNAFARRVLEQLASAMDAAKQNLARAEMLQRANRGLHERAAATPETVADASKAVSAGRTMLRELRKQAAQLRQLNAEVGPYLRGGGAPESAAADPGAAAEPLEPLAPGEKPARDAVEAQLAALESAAQSGSGEGAPQGWFDQLVAITDRVYAETLALHKRVSVRLSLMPPDVHQIEPVTVPTEPGGPGPAEVVARFAAYTVFGTLFLLLLMEQGSSKVRGHQAIAKVTGLPILGVVLSDASLRSATTTSAILMHEEAATPTAESLREVRTALKYRKDAAARSILFTSAMMAEGKTTVSSNLAISFAHLGERVLLVDADLRRPKVHRLFGISNEVGISQLLVEPDVEKLIRPTAVPGLSILTSGPLLANPAEFLCSPQFAQVMRSLTQSYDRLVVDSSPLNHVADSGILVHMVEGVVLVVRDRTCVTSALEAAVERLRASSARMLGVVVNDLEPGVGGGGYGYGYGYYYRADDEETRG